jgi:hypothetical protein
MRSSAKGLAIAIFFPAWLVFGVLLLTATVLTGCGGGKSSPWNLALMYDDSGTGWSG